MPAVLVALLLTLMGSAVRAEEPSVPAEEIVAGQVDPEQVELRGPRSMWTLLVTGTTRAGREVDLTTQATFTSSDPDRVRVTEQGQVFPRADGTATVTVSAAGRSWQVPVRVSDATVPPSYHFEQDILPVFSRFGCNTSGCHGKAEGQNGFKLSVFGFDPPADYNAICKEGRGRRIFPAAPELSLVLAKAVGDVPHGGGVRFSPDSDPAHTLAGWIRQGLPYGDPQVPALIGITVSPRSRVLALGARQRLRVVARYADGREQDVTRLARFQTNNDSLASVDETGLVTAGQVPGQVAVMASYLGAVEIFQALVPRPEKIESYPELPAFNFVDVPVKARWQALNLLPAEVCDDATYLRRAYLDVIGKLPTAAEARKFLADTQPDRRAKLIDELLNRPEYADYWALKWADLLQVERQKLGYRGAYEYYRWIHESFARHVPADQFVRALLLAEGPVKEAPAGHFYEVITKPGDQASAFSQVFLGIRLACAECHHHPYDRWSQTDYYGMQTIFAPVQKKTNALGTILAVQGEPQAVHPRTGEKIYAYPLGANPTTENPKGDRRPVLADWLTAPDNPYFARNLANRYWAHFLGRGIVEPVDDVRATNPPCNPELLDALARELVEKKFDLRALIRAIMRSGTYQLATTPNETNAQDEQNFSRALLRKVDAEVLFDAVCDTTGVSEKFAGVGSGVRAVQLWDNRVNHYFLKLFGRPVRESACTCERNGEASIGQVLHLLNSPDIQAKLSHAGGQVSRLVREVPENGALIDEVYLTFYSRFPTAAERTNALNYFAQQQDRRQATEDLCWSLMNSLEFVFNH